MAFLRQPILQIFFVLSVCLILSRASANQAPRIVVVLADHLTLGSILRSDLPNVSRLRATGQLALVSPGLARPPDPAANAYATLTAGDVVNTQNEHLGLLERQILANGAQRRVRLLHFGDASSPSHLRALDALLGRLDVGPSRPDILMVCSPVPPQDAQGKWDRLTPLIVSGFGTAGGTLTTDTTHTVGLVALRDLASAILALARLPIPDSMIGTPFRLVTVTDRDALLNRLDRVTDFNQRVLLAFAWFFGLSAGLAVGGAGWVVAKGAIPYPALARYFMRMVVATPLALLLAPIFLPPTLPLYALELFASVLLCGLIPSLGVLYAITVLVLVVDAMTGTHLVAASPISGYWLSGIRFYGIGNEYMGSIIGMALVAPFLALTSGPSPSPAHSSLGRGGARC